MSADMKLSLSTTLLVTEWAKARQNEKTFNDMVMAIKNDEQFANDNKDFFAYCHQVFTSDFNDLLEYPRGFEKRVKWAKKDHAGKDEQTIFNYACYAFIADKAHTKITNLRSRPQFKNKKGVSIARPTGWDARYGVSLSRGRKAIDWKGLTSLFDQADYTDD